MIENEQTAIRFVLSEIEVEKYLNKEFNPQIQWYEREADEMEQRLTRCTWAGIVFGILSTILAASPDSLLKLIFSTGYATAGEVCKWLVVITTVIASTANGVLIPRYRRMANSREKGRVKTTLQAKVAAIELRMVPMTKQERAQWLITTAQKLMEVEDEHGGTVHASIASEASSENG